MIEVTVKKIGEANEVVSLEDNSTVADAIAASGKNADGMVIHKDGITSSLTDMVDDESVVFISRALKDE